MTSVVARGGPVPMRSLHPAPTDATPALTYATPTPMHWEKKIRDGLSLFGVPNSWRSLSLPGVPLLGAFLSLGGLCLWGCSVSLSLTDATPTRTGTIPVLTDATHPDINNLWSRPRRASPDMVLTPCADGCDPYADQCDLYEVLHDPCSDRCDPF